MAETSDRIALIRARLQALSLPEPADGEILALARLSVEEPVRVLLEQAKGGLIKATVFAFDHPFEFSSITGIMAATGFSIESSDAITLPRVKSPAKRGLRPATKLQRRDPAVDALILDRFHGKLAGPGTDFKKWSKGFEADIIQVIGLLDKDVEESTERAKRLVNERVTEWLKTRHKPRTDLRVAEWAAIKATVEQTPNATRLSLQAPDAPAFLYALSTALALHGLQIQKTRIQTIDGRAVDQIDLTDSHGQPLKDARVEELRLSVLLTHQFAYYLDRAPDPFTALRRFEELSEKIISMPQRSQWMELLSHPATMSDLAKVLGASDYLWEDFIRIHADALLPIFQQRASGQEVAPPARSLPRRLEESLKGAKNFDEQRERLNEFKDRELFLIDLEHILASERPDAAFQVLSERLVLMAESLVMTAAKLVYAEMVRLYGKPLDAQGNEVGFATFGLGKLGGVALGYASDIELLFLFGAAGKTAGGTRGAMPNDEFFAIFTRETCDYIHAKREGIFQVDLRLRPFGKGGPLACSRAQFAEYYGANGDAHPFERLALVRLRWIAGEAKLGFEIEQLRDAIVYDGPPPDVKAIWDITGRMRAQHLEGRKLNSKYSPGALTDLEGAVQLLQVAHARQAPQLRTPRLHEALEGLRRAQILSPVEFDELMGAYQFLRRLINAQRVLRGSAQDLSLPESKSDELIHLARRMNYIPVGGKTHVGAMLLDDFQRNTSAVEQFIKRRLKRLSDT